MDNMDKIVSLCKRRGFIYPGSEIYGGLGGFWDYGPLGVELKKNIKNEWWKKMVQLRDDIVGLDGAIITNPQVWVASGHVTAFTDPLIECKACKKRFRADKVPGAEVHKKDNIEYIKVPEKLECPSGGHELDVDFADAKNRYAKSRKFNLLMEAGIGVVNKTTVYLRGEITQSVFINFKNIVDSTRIKIPFGIAQIGKAFRNEITPGNFTYRSREFEQMEMEFFIQPDEKEAANWFSFWKNERLNWYLSLGMDKNKLRFRQHEEDEKAHYARMAEDIEFKAPFGWSEFEGIHHRGDWDLSRHKIKYQDKDSNTEYIPWVIETSGGVDRSTLFFLINAYHEEGKRTVLKLHPKLAPYKAAVFPLVANKEEISGKAKSVYHLLKEQFFTAWDDRGNIGKRYLAQDEIGTPWCVTIDYVTLEDDTVTVRDRDTTRQERVKINKLTEYIKQKNE